MSLVRVSIRFSGGLLACLLVILGACKDDARGGNQPAPQSGTAVVPEADDQSERGAATGPSKCARIVKIVIWRQRVEPRRAHTTIDKNRLDEVARLLHELRGSWRPLLGTISAVTECTIDIQCSDGTHSYYSPTASEGTVLITEGWMAHLTPDQAEIFMHLCQTNEDQ